MPLGMPVAFRIVLFCVCHGKMDNAFFRNKVMRIFYFQKSLEFTGYWLLGIVKKNPSELVRGANYELTKHYGSGGSS